MTALEPRTTVLDPEARPPLPTSETHQVENQPPALEDYNSFSTDVPLNEAVIREGGGWGLERLEKFGALVGSARVITLGHQANRNPPILRTHDRFGRRIDEVEFHPAWHELMTFGSRARNACSTVANSETRRDVVRAALEYLYYQQEAGVGCPLTMTFAAVPTLRKQPEIADEWLPRITSNVYDPRMIPAAEKRGAHRHGDDGKTGGFGRAGQHDAGPGDRPRRSGGRIPADGAQMVLLGPDERCLFDAGANGTGPVVFSRPTVACRRQTQYVRHPAAQGQAGKPLQRVERDRIPRHMVPADRRRGARRARPLSKW